MPRSASAVVLGAAASALVALPTTPRSALALEFLTIDAYASATECSGTLSSIETEFVTGTPITTFGTCVPVSSTQSYTVSSCSGQFVLYSASSSCSGASTSYALNTCVPKSQLPSTFTGAAYITCTNAAQYTNITTYSASTTCQGASFSTIYPLQQCAGGNWFTYLPGAIPVVSWVYLGGNCSGPAVPYVNVSVNQCGAGISPGQSTIATVFGSSSAATRAVLSVLVAVAIAATASMTA